MSAVPPVASPRIFVDTGVLLHAVDDLVDALESGRAPLCTVEDGLIALRIAVAARKSAAEGGCRIRV